MSNETVLPCASVLNAFSSKILTEEPSPSQSVLNNSFSNIPNSSSSSDDASLSLAVVSDNRSKMSPVLSTSKSAEILGDFTSFRKLPIELRCRIWMFALPGPREVDFTRSFSTPTPVLFHVNRESRAEIKRDYSDLMIPGESDSAHKRIYFNPEIDTLVTDLESSDCISNLASRNAEFFDRVKKLKIESLRENRFAIAYMEDEHFWETWFPARHFRNLYMLVLEMKDSGVHKYRKTTDPLPYVRFFDYLLRDMYEGLENGEGVEGLVKPDLVVITWIGVLSVRIVLED